MSHPRDVHLVILIHGLWGSPAHLDAAKRELEEAYRQARDGPVERKENSVTGPSDDPIVRSRVEGSDEELVVVIAGGMTSQLTYDGVDVCASRVAWEVDEQVSKLEKEGKKVTKFSITGYSLGGLVARYLVGLLEARTPSFFDTYRPVSFSTIATPHLGIPRYNTWISTWLCWLGARLLSRSGEQLYVTDKYSEHDPRPLLEIMADPNEVFVQGLEKFERLRIYGNAIKDETVPYPSAAIDTVDHFAEWEDRGVEVEADEDGIMVDWQKGEAVPAVKRGWSQRMGTLPPVLRFSYPYNYMVPLLLILVIARFLLDTRQSQHRLQQLAQIKVPIPEEQSDPSRPSTPIPSAKGLSVSGLRRAIRRVERSIESKVIKSVDRPKLKDHRSRSSFRRASSTAAHPDQSQTGQEDVLKVHMKDSQLRMAVWLNTLPWKKVLTWYPEVPDSHGVIVVREPATFPVHEQGRGLLKRWARGVLDTEAGPESR